MRDLTSADQGLYPSIIYGKTLVIGGLWVDEMCQSGPDEDADPNNTDRLFFKETVGFLLEKRCGMYCAQSM